MMSPEDLLYCYDDLSPEERDEADVYLSQHPEAQVLIEEGRRLRGLVRLAETPPKNDGLSDALADHVAARFVAGPHCAPDEGDLSRADLADPEPDLQRQQDALTARAEGVLRNSTPSREHFEALTGRTLGVAERSASPSRGVPRRPSPPSHTAPARPSPARSSLRRLGSIAALLLVTLYGGLFLAGEATRSTPEQLAALEQVPTPYEGLRLRGSDGEVDRVADRYAAGREALLAARTSVLGLFPRYDEAYLAQALEAFEAAVAFDSPRGALGLEALYQTGRIHLHRGDVSAAREALREVVSRGGPSAPEARSLLSAMDDRGL